MTDQIDVIDIPMGHSKSTSKRQVQSNKIANKRKKIRNKGPNLIPKATRERTTKPRVTRRKETIKIETEVKAIENRTVEKINEKASFSESIKQN